MTAAELRLLSERLCQVEPHDYEDRVTLEAAAEIIDLLAWVEEKRVEVESGPTLLDTLRRAREAAR